MTYVPRCNRLHFYFQRVNLLFASGVPRSRALAEDVLNLLFALFTTFVVEMFRSQVRKRELLVRSVKHTVYWRTNMAAYTPHMILMLYEILLIIMF